MKENIKFQFVRIPLSNDDGTIECVGVVDNNAIGVEVFQHPSGGYDVATFVYDNDSSDWMAVGDAEEVNHFATAAEARHHGIVTLLTEVQCYLR